MSEPILSTWGSWSSSGPAPADRLPKELAPELPLKAFMGWDGLFVNHPEVNVVEMAREYMDRARKESCGQCAPCRLGTVEISEILERICSGNGRKDDLSVWKRLATLMKDTSRCDIGQTTPRPILDALEQRRADFDRAVSEAKPILRGRYAALVTAPCKNACPSHLDIPGYVEQVRFGQWDESLKVVRQDCPLPGVIGRVCVRPCESSCRRSRVDESIAIRALKRYAADQERHKDPVPPKGPAPTKSKKVAVVGAGPAGLSCAYYLSLMGYPVTVFERLNEPGGMAAIGIPDYRLPRTVLREEAARVEALGAEIRYGVNIGEDMTLDDLRSRGYNAVFVGVGAPESSKMHCENEDAGFICFMTGIHFLHEVSQGRQPIEGKKMLVIGGGNVAMDCVRSALRMGFDDVNLLYRRTEAEMPADPVEIEEAKEEGVKFHYLVAPTRILSTDGKVSGLECQRMELGEPDASGRRRPVAVEGSDFVIPCDAIVPAIGQICVVDCVLPEAELSSYKTLVVDSATFRSSQPDVFGGGDCVTGPYTLIAALAAGKKGAKFIDQYLETGNCEPDPTDWLEKMVEKLGVYDSREEMPIPGLTHKLHPPVMDPVVRIRSFDEVEGETQTAEALNEAERCLRCYRIALAAL